MLEEAAPTFGGFSILAELGRGTTGIVYEARDLTLNRRVALMIPILEPDVERPVKVRRFHRACQVLAYLTSEPNSNIPALHMVGENQGRVFSIRELVDGSTLEQRVAERSIDLRVGLWIIAGVATIVDWVHGRGFAHRNLSPANVLVATDGTPKLIGFGRVGLLAGSAHLSPGASGMSPEIDVQAMRDMLCWVCSTLGEPVPSALQRVLRPDSVSSPGVFAEVIRSYLFDGPTETDRPRA